MNSPLLSGIIPAYNSAEYLLEGVGSILSQNYSPLEIIVVDDGSTDNTAEIIRSMPGVKYYHQENLGPAAARNLGIQKSNGSFIAFHDADDISLAGRLSLQMQLLLNYPYLDFCLCRLQNFI